jgi:ubiquinone/menaquinone biosynthesis C-methylase UbiE
MDEINKIKERYERRKGKKFQDKYLITNRDVLMLVQERERILVNYLHKNDMTHLENKKILEVGCGTGSNLLDFIRLGASPKNIVGNDLLEERIITASSRLPKDVTLICSDASTLVLPKKHFDIVLQSTVFTSILDNDFQKKLADHMWELTKPGGAIIWYDFMIANPYNKDVKAVSVKKVKELFPYAQINIKKITLFPFIAKAITKHTFFAYSILNKVPFLKMHILCWIKKPFE